MKRLLHNICYIMVAHHLKMADAWLSDLWRYASEEEKEYVRRRMDKEGIRIPYER